jgi:hypothetical protein
VGKLKFEHQYSERVTTNMRQRESCNPPTTSASQNIAQSIDFGMGVPFSGHSWRLMDETSGLIVALQCTNTEHGMGIKINMRLKSNHWAFIQNKSHSAATQVSQQSTLDFKKDWRWQHRTVHLTPTGSAYKSANIHLSKRKEYYVI